PPAGGAGGRRRRGGGLRGALVYHRPAGAGLPAGAGCRRGRAAGGGGAAGERGGGQTAPSAAGGSDRRHDGPVSEDGRTVRIRTSAAALPVVLLLTLCVIPLATARPWLLVL